MMYQVRRGFFFAKVPYNLLRESDSFGEKHDVISDKSNPASVFYCPKIAIVLIIIFGKTKNNKFMQAIKLTMR